MVEKKGLRSYLSRSPDNETEGGILQDNNVTTTTTNSDTTLDNKTTQSESLFRSFEPVLDQILDDCIIGSNIEVIVSYIFYTLYSFNENYFVRNG